MSVAGNLTYWFLYSAAVYFLYFSFVFFFFFFYLRLQLTVVDIEMRRDTSKTKITKNAMGLTLINDG